MFKLRSLQTIISGYPWVWIGELENGVSITMQYRWNHLEVFSGNIKAPVFTFTTNDFHGFKDLKKYTRSLIDFTSINETKFMEEDDL